MNCGHTVGSQPDSIRHEITKDEAIEIAVQEIISRGWREDDIGRVFADFIEENSEDLDSFSDCWVVFVDGKEPYVGNHISIFLSTQGEVLKVHGGR